MTEQQEISWDALEIKRPPLVIVLSGPSGVGKDVTLIRMRQLGYPFHYVVTATTRPRRPGEVDGVDYLFLAAEDFQKMIKENQFLEYAQVYGNFYGVPKQSVREALAGGEDVVIKADVQGAATIKKILPEAVFIFLAPPSMHELAQRLSERKTESEEGLARRLKAGYREMASLPQFDYYVVNWENKLDEAVHNIAAIITAERSRVHPRQIVI